MNALVWFDPSGVVWTGKEGWRNGIACEIFFHTSHQSAYRVSLGPFSLLDREGERKRGREEEEKRGRTLPASVLAPAFASPLSKSTRYPSKSFITR